MNEAGMAAQPVIEAPRPQLGWAELVTDTYSIYRRRFWRFFLLALVPSALAYGFGIFTQLYINPWVRQYVPWSGFLSNYWRSLAILSIASIAEGFIYVALSAFFFAAISANILDGTAEAFSDGYEKPRARLFPVLAVAAVVWILFYLGRTLGGYVIWATFPRILRVQGATGLTVILLLIIIVPLSRFGAAIPALLADADLTISASIRESIKCTQGWGFFFALFCLKSAILGYAAWWLAIVGMNWMWEHHLLNNSSYPWAQRIIFVSLTAMLESPLFIAFSLLYKGGESRDPSAAIVS